MASNNTGMTLLYDLNQVGGNIRAGDTKMLRSRLASWRAGLDAIPQIGHMSFSINYRNSREIAEYYQRVLVDLLPGGVETTVHLFGSGEVVVDDVSRSELAVHIARLVQALRRDYDDGEIGLVFNSAAREQLVETLRQLRGFGITTTSNVQDREQLLTASPRDIKGHERKAIILCTPPMEDAIRKMGKAIDVYVALTRARDRLVVLQVH